MRIRKIAAMAVSVMMAVSAAGCSNKDGKNKNMSETSQKGRYVESPVDISPEMAEYPGEFTAADGKICFTDTCEDPKTVENVVMDGGKFSSQTQKLNFPVEDVFINMSQMLPDGRGAVMYFDNQIMNQNFSNGNAITFETDEDGNVITNTADAENADGETSEEISEEVSEEVTEEQSVVVGGEDDEDGYVDFGQRFGVIDSSGNVTHTDIEDVQDFELTGDGKLFVINSHKELYEVDLDTGKSELLYQGGSGTLTYIDVAGKYVLISAADSDEVVIYDTEAEETISGTEALNDFWKENIVSSSGNALMGEKSYDFCAGEDGTIYCACASGIYRYVIGGNKVEQLMDGSTTALSMSCNNQNGPKAIVYESTDSFLVQCPSGLMRYKYDPDAEITEQKVMKIYALNASPQLNTAINTFRRANPDISIDLETGMNGEKTYEDAVKDLTTEIVSGDAPDVIILDGLNIQNLTDKGLLTDLSDSLKDIMPAEGLIENAALWNRTSDGKLYSAAGVFEIPCVASTETDPDTLTDLKSTADAADKLKSEGKTAIDLSAFSSAAYMDNMIDCYGGEISDGKGSADKDKLKDFFEDCKRIYDASSKLPYSETYDEKYDSSALNYLLIDGANLVPARLDAYTTSINGLTSLKDYNSNVKYRYGTGSSISGFVPKLNAAVCSKSEQPEEAKAFIKSMLSKENQDSYVNDYLAVNEESFKFNFNDRDDLFVGTMVGEPGSDKCLSVDFKPTDEAEEAELMEYLNKMDTAVLFDTQTVGKLVDAGAAYMRDEMTLDEAVEQVSSFLALRSME